MQAAVTSDVVNNTKLQSYSGAGGSVSGRDEGAPSFDALVSSFRNDAPGDADSSGGVREKAPAAESSSARSDAGGKKDPDVHGNDGTQMNSAPSDGRNSRSGMISRSADGKKPLSARSGRRGDVSAQAAEEKKSISNAKTAATAEKSRKTAKRGGSLGESGEDASEITVPVEIHFVDQSEATGVVEPPAEEPAREDAGTEISIGLSAAWNSPQTEAPDGHDDTAENLALSGRNPESSAETRLDPDGKITVTDLRAEDAGTGDGQSGDGGHFDGDGTGGGSLPEQSRLASGIQPAEPRSAVQGDSQGGGHTFRSMLGSQIRDNVPEFVRAGNIVLRDGNQGTINLVLHPEELGNVRIHLSLDGKTVSGHITVATREAFEAFRDNAESLRQAFVDSGFDAAGFDVAYSDGQNSGGGGFEGDGRGQDGGREVSGRRIYDGIAGGQNSPVRADKNDPVYSNYSVNIVA